MTSSSDVATLATGVSYEHATIYAYGVIGAFTQDGTTLVNDALAAHRARRDAVSAAITKAHGKPPLASPGYSLPSSVTDAPSAAALALRLEVDGTTVWRSVVERCDDADARALAVDALSDCALRAAKWRGLTGVSPRTVALPGNA